ncbi:MAG: MurR/RpiR family transcriptional regulator [Oscillospiraceae bacterium]|jgi:DNA-binding MurR/RpiR family transcriptional regulator|nr:MurR/RpiR family transcriptional regulator [Oscillospiraceae bacterium]
MPADLLFLEIEKAMPSFSKGQKRIAAYIMEHCEKAAFMTAARLGDTVGVSESTVVRFAAEMGYDGYPVLQKALREVARNRLTAVQRMEVASDRIGSGDILRQVLQTDADTLRRTLELTDRSVFDSVVDSVIAARRIYVIGVRSAAAIATFMSFYFTHIFEDVRNVDTASTGAIFEQMLRIGPGDVFIGITFSRYSSRTVKAASFARESGATVIAITDSYSAPICRVADHVLVAGSDMAGFVDSLVAPLSIVNALIMAIGMRKREEITAVYDRLEDIWEQYNVYQREDGNAFEV